MKNFGPDSPDVARSYAGLGLACFKTGDYNRAIDSFVKVGAIDKKLRGDDDVLVGLIDFYIGSIYEVRGNHEQALDYLKQSLSILLKNPGPESPDYTARCYNNIGTAYFNKGEYGLATDNFKKALAIGLKKQGMEHSAPGQAPIEHYRKNLEATPGKSIPQLIGDNLLTLP